MGQAMFYHLTRHPLEATLPQLLARSLQRGWRVVVRSPDDERLDWLDRKLWQGPEEGFLPHGRAGGQHDADQPVLLTSGAAIPNGAGCLMAIDGASVSPAEAKTLDRVCILFDGANPEAVQHARGQWKQLTDAGVAAEYWSEESGKWEMKSRA